MPALFNFEVHTLYRPFYSGKAESISLTLPDGEIGVFANHCAFTAPVMSCILKIKDAKGELRNAFITEGILQVKEHKTVLMVDAAEWPHEIDAERALAAKQNAEELIAKKPLKFEAENIKAKLRRAVYRMKAGELGKREK